MCYHADPRRAILALAEEVPDDQPFTEVVAITDEEVVSFLIERPELLVPAGKIESFGYGAKLTLAITTRREEVTAIKQFLAHQKASVAA